MTDSQKTLVADEQRRLIVRSLVSVGVDYQRASIIADIGAKCAAAAIAAINRTASTAPDQGVFLSALEIGLQLTAATAKHMSDSLHEMGKANGTTFNVVEIKMGGEG